MSELAGIFCAAFWCRARFTFITFVAAELKAATSKPRRSSIWRSSFRAVTSIPSTRRWLH